MICAAKIYYFFTVFKMITFVSLSLFTMKVFHLISLGAAALFSVACGSNSLQSPDKSIKAVIDGQSIAVYYGESQVISDLHVGIITQSQNLDSALVLSSQSGRKLIKEEYDMPAGKRLHCSNSANEKILTYKNPSGEELQVVLRLYNDGVALRYVTAEGTMVLEDRTSYSVADGVNRWIANYDASNEQPFPLSTDGSVGTSKYGRAAKNSKWSYPALVEPVPGIFALISEADIRVGDSGSYLVNEKDKEVYEVTLEGPNAYNKGMSPWRCAIIGELSDIAESTLITDLASPSEIADPSWIQPGVSSWIYWAYNHGSKDFELCKTFIDLAAQMGWPYCLVDWEWPEMTGGYDLNDVMAYAREKGVKINLWYNSGTSWIGPGAPQPQDRLNTPESREREMQWLEEIGVSGIKVDFFSPLNDEMAKYYIDILRDAARHHLLVDFHGCTIPNGWQRTWPNMMSMEAIYGAEWYNNGPFFGPTAAVHNATVPFTRNVVGPMDYTPGSFSDSQYAHLTTNAHELALPVLFESGIQHMADRPAGYFGDEAAKNVYDPDKQARIERAAAMATRPSGGPGPRGGFGNVQVAIPTEECPGIPQEALDVYSGLPSIWDDTKLLAGYPGEFVVMARRSGSKWYIAGINGKSEPVDIAFSLERLGVSASSNILFCDGPQDRIIDVKTLELDGDSASVPCRARGGFLVVID